MHRREPHGLVVGGGLAGLAAATALGAHGLRSTILDKGRGIGGRLATRRVSDERAGQGVLDYGAQYFTVRDPRFRAWVDGWLAGGIVEEWSRGFGTEDGTVRGRGEPRYRGTRDLRDVARHLARDLEVHTSTRVDGLTWDRDGWTAHTDGGARFQGDFLLLTPPVPQSLALLEGSRLPLPAEVEGRLHDVSYQPCLAVLAVLPQPSRIPPPGGLWLRGEPLAWMADNQQKGISPEATAVTLQAGPAFSREHWETDEPAVAGRLLLAATPWLGSEPLQVQVHRWRYAQPTSFYGEPCLVLDSPGPLALAGDGLVAARIEGAFLSGLAAAEALLDRLERADNG